MGFCWLNCRSSFEYDSRLSNIFAQLTYKPWIPFVVLNRKTEEMLLKTHNRICLWLHWQCTFNLNAHWNRSIWIMAIAFVNESSNSHQLQIASTAFKNFFSHTQPSPYLHTHTQLCWFFCALDFYLYLFLRGKMQNEGKKYHKIAKGI